MNDPRWGSEADAVTEDGGEEDALSIPVCDRFTPSKEGDTNELAERPRGWDLASNCGTFGD